MAGKIDELINQIHEAIETPESVRVAIERRQRNPKLTGVTKPELVWQSDPVQVKKEIEGILTRKLPQFSPAEVDLVQCGAFRLCQTCLPPGEMITGNPGPVSIDKIPEGSRVLGGDGKYHKVVAKGSRAFSGDLIEITPFDGLPVKVTPDHLILISDRPEIKDRKRTGWIRNKDIPINPVWKKAGELTKNDFLVSAPLEDEVEVSSINVQYADYPHKNARTLNGFTNVHGTINFDVKITPDLVRLCGYWVAEGCLSRNGDVNLSFGILDEERGIVDDAVKILKSLGFETAHGRKRKENGIAVSATNLYFNRFLLTQFGEYCDKKSIPNWLMLAPKSLQKEFLKGMFRGDGSVTKIGKRTLVSCCTTSQKLAYQIALLLQRLQITASIRPNKKKQDRKQAWTIVVCKQEHINTFGRDLFDTRIGKIEEKAKHKDLSWFKDGKEIRCIRQIRRVSYVGPVFDVEVETAHSFQGIGICMHNCLFFKPEKGEPDGLCLYRMSETDKHIESDPIMRFRVRPDAACDGWRPRKASWKNPKELPDIPNFGNLPFGFANNIPCKNSQNVLDGRPWENKAKDINVVGYKNNALSRMCATCRFFGFPNTCRIVDSPVTLVSFCHLYTDTIEVIARPVIDPHQFGNTERVGPDGEFAWKEEKSEKKLTGSGD